jgi:hypothetical protein
LCLNGDLPARSRKIPSVSAVPDKKRCVLCSINPADSVEHVPPRSFFESPYPDNLITVPSSVPCNQGSHLDDDYLLAFLVSLDTPGASPTLDVVRARVTRGLHRPSFPGLRRRLQEAVEFSYVRDPATNTRVANVGIRPEPDRLTKVLQKQVRGLAYYITGTPVQRSTFTQLERTHNMQTRPPKFWEMWVKASEYAQRGQTGRVGDVFGYAYREVKRSALAAVVRLEYYGVFSYVALIYQPDFAPPQRVSMPF